MFQFFDSGKIENITSKIEYKVFNIFMKINEKISLIINCENARENFDDNLDRNLNSKCTKFDCFLCKIIGIVEFRIFSRFLQFNSKKNNTSLFPKCSLFGFRSSKSFSEDWFENSDKFLTSEK